MNWYDLAREQNDISYENAQGFFRYYKEGGEYQRVLAINGQLYQDARMLVITGLFEGFQKERPVEAVQFRDKLYIATGTVLVEYDGTDARVVEPHKPEALEALYVGTNGLSDTPDDYMQDGVSSVTRIDGVTFNKRYAVANQDFIRATAYVSKPDNVDLEYRFERRLDTHREDYWFLGQDWNSQKFYEFSTDWEGNMQMRVQVRDAASKNLLHEYYVPRYIIKPVRDPSDDEVPSDHIQTCNRITLHWDRLILYGNTHQPDALFISHLNNPAYFPIPNSLVFESVRRDPITKVLKYRDHLAVFTETSIQALFGKSPKDYERVVQNTDTGCIAPDSAVVVDNHIIFLSHQGIQLLKTLAMDENKANISELDRNIKPLVHQDRNAVGILVKSEYHLVYPDRGERLRYYFRRLIWTKDKSPVLDFVAMHTFDGYLYALRKNGEIVRNAENRHRDLSHVFNVVIETKNYDFDEPYHIKKPKEIQFIMGNDNFRTQLSLDVLLQGIPIVSTESTTPHLSKDGYIDLNKDVERNITSKGSTIFGNWVLGDSLFGETYTNVYKERLFNRGRNMKMKLQHKEDFPMLFLGVGIIFKLKAP